METTRTTENEAKDAKLASWGHTLDGAKHSDASCWQCGYDMVRRSTCCFCGKKRTLREG